MTTTTKFAEDLCVGDRTEHGEVVELSHANDWVAVTFFANVGEYVRMLGRDTAIEIEGGDDVTTTIEAELVGHSKTGLWLRVLDGEAFKILTYSHEGIKLAQSVTKGAMLRVEVTDPEIVWISFVSWLGSDREYDVWGWRFAGEILDVKVAVQALSIDQQDAIDAAERRTD